MAKKKAVGCREKQQQSAPTRSITFNSGSKRGRVEKLSRAVEGPQADEVQDVVDLPSPAFTAASVVAAVNTCTNIATAASDSALHLDVCHRLALGGSRSSGGEVYQQELPGSYQEDGESPADPLELFEIDSSYPCGDAFDTYPAPGPTVVVPSPQGRRDSCLADHVVREDLLRHGGILGPSTSHLALTQDPHEKAVHQHERPCFSQVLGNHFSVADLCFLVTQAQALDIPKYAAALDTSVQQGGVASSRGGEFSSAGDGELVDNLSCFNLLIGGTSSEMDPAGLTATRSEAPGWDVIDSTLDS